jgi:DNA-binding CsgD family transcriptional regulator
MEPCRPEALRVPSHGDDLRVYRAVNCFPDDQTVSDMAVASRLTEADFLAVLNLLTQGVVITDSESTLLFINRAAAEIMAESDGLSTYSGRLGAARSRETAAIRRLIAVASADRNAPPRTLSVPRPSMRRPLAIVVASLRAPRVRATDAGPSAIVFINDLERALPVSPMLIQELYGLTPAEAAVAARATRGDGLASVSEELQISEATVRSHLQRVFQKTGTRRQAQLTRLLIESCAGLAVDRPDRPSRSRPSLGKCRDERETAAQF